MSRFLSIIYLAILFFSLPLECLLAESADEQDHASRSLEKIDPHKYFSSVTGHFVGDVPCVLFEYWTTSLISFRMCLGRDDLDVKNGRVVLNVIKTRGYHPKCRGLHHLLWMYETVVPLGSTNGIFLDVGSYIGTCTFHMASLGYNVVTAEGHPLFVDIMMRTMQVNPAFHNEVELHHAMLGRTSKYSKGLWWSAGSGNNANSGFKENPDDPDATEFEVMSLASLVRDRRVSVALLNCQGRELEVLEGSEELLRSHAIPILKLYYNPTLQEQLGGPGAAQAALRILHKNDYVILHDQFPEHSMYYGANADMIYDVDHLFGSQRFNIPGDEEQRIKLAREVLNAKVDHETLPHTKRPVQDIIAIARPVYEKLLGHFPQEASTTARKMTGTNTTV